MIIYNPNSIIDEKRIKEAQAILREIKVKHCFISGSFLYKEKYKDIDLFVISRSKKPIHVTNKNVRITVIDFNDLHSLFYHSISKSCISKNILPSRQIKTTLSDYWEIVNESVPNLMNTRSKKDARSLLLYTEYFITGNILNSSALNDRVSSFRDYKDILDYIKKIVPSLINNKIKRTYIKRFFYTQAGYYKNLRKHTAQNFLYKLSHMILGGVHG